MKFSGIFINDTRGRGFLENIVFSINTEKTELKLLGVLGFINLLVILHIFWDKVCFYSFQVCI